MADPLQEYPTELAERLALIESNLHFIVRLELTREEAMDIKKRCGLPISLLNQKFGFDSLKDMKRKVYHRNAY